MFTFFLLLNLLPSLISAHLLSPPHRHRGALRRLRRQQDDAEDRGSNSCQVQLPQDQIDQWSTWMQEGFNACTKTAAQSLKAGDDDLTQVVMCYRIGFVDTEKQRFGGELLVMQVGDSNQADASASSESASESSTDSSSTDSSSTESSSTESSNADASTASQSSSAAIESSSAVVDLTAAKSTPANLGVAGEPSASSAAGVGAAVLGFSSVDAASATASASSSAAVGIGAAVVSSGLVPVPTAKARMIRRQRDGTKLPRGQFQVQLSWGRGSQATTSSMSLVDTLGNDLISSTTIDAPSFKGLIGADQAQLLGSTHFTRAFPAGSDFDGQDLTAFSPSSIDLIGQAGTMASVSTVLVDLASVSASMTGFGDKPQGLFEAVSSRSNRLTFDDRCIVVADDSGSSSSGSVAESSTEVSSTEASSTGSSSSSDSTTSSEAQATTSSDFSAAAAAVQTESSSSSAQAGIGAQFISSSAVPLAAASSAPASAPTSTISLAGCAVVASSSAAAQASSSSSDAGVASAAAANDQSAEFQLPGRQIQVLPIGLGVFAGVSVLALAIVGIVTYERRKYRAQFRARKMAEQVARASYGGVQMREGRV